MPRNEESSREFGEVSAPKIVLLHRRVIQHKMTGPGSCS